MPASSSMPDMVGTFRIIRRLGSAGFAEAFLAEDTNPRYKGDKVTVKRVQPQMMEQDPLFRLALVSEGEIGKLISHSNIVQVYDLIEKDGVPFLISEYVDGILLSELMSTINGPVDPSVAAEIARQLCEALVAVHAAVDASGHPLGIVHQDLRPSNICLNQRGDVKLLEAGVARTKVLGRGGAKLRSEVSSYTSPEQGRGESFLTPASDQYSIGIIVLEMVTGTPFLTLLSQMAKMAEQRIQQMSSLPDTEDSVIVKLDDLADGLHDTTLPFDGLPPVDKRARFEWSRRQLPRHLSKLQQLPGAGLDEILGKMLAYDAADRYGQMRDAGEELLRWGWGMSGRGVDFRDYVGQAIGQFRGGAKATTRKLNLDDEAIRAAAESSFLPPPELENLAPTPESRETDHAEDRYPSPGVLMDLDVGIPEPEVAYRSAEKEFRTKTDPQVNAPKNPNAPPAPESAAATLRRIKPMTYVGAASVVVLAIAAVFVIFNPELMVIHSSDPRPASKPVSSETVVTGQKPKGLEDMLSSSGGGEIHGLRSEGAAPAGTGPTATAGKSKRAAENQETEPLDDLGGDPPKRLATRAATGDVPTAKLKTEQLKAFTGKVLPGTANLTVSTSPPGATVILDGIEIEESPITFENITAGEHKIILRSEELGLRHEKVLLVKGGGHWKGTYSFREQRWIENDDE